jgi:UDP-N-acetylglucosamine diphosphorylase/glucosamine-1-phosphate N-acetyltransferase
MAGGLGKRMNSDLPKVLHCIKGKPMLVRVLEQSLLLNPDKILIIVGKYEEIIRNTLSEYMDISKIEFVLQPEPLGTGHAIQCCLGQLEENDESSCTLILSGDVPLLQHNTLMDFLQGNCEAKLMTTLLDNPTGYGRIIEDNNVFTKIVEEKDCLLKEKLVKKVNCGIYVFDTNLLCKYIVKIDNNNSQKEYYLTDIIKLIKLYKENINIDTFDIAKEIQYQIMGVNTVEQLTELETHLYL